MQPFAKFWGTKVLVSIAFIQSLVLYLPPFNSWSPTKQNLFYASALSLECFIVALLHLASWGHTEHWYNKPEYEKVKIAASFKNPALAHLTGMHTPLIESLNSKDWKPPLQ